jgi:hypothetical protein
MVVASIAAIALAQEVDIKLQVGGVDQNGDAKIQITAGACTGGFGTADSEGAWWTGIASHEGMDTDTLVGWGRTLCENDVVNWDSDYTIKVQVDGVTYDTGHSFTCNK